MNVGEASRVLRVEPVWQGRSMRSVRRRGARTIVQSADFRERDDVTFRDDNCA
jgi:hypothetical protein